MGRWIVWRRHRFTWRGQRLAAYLWDARVARTACRACALGTGEILRRTWRWITETPGERIWRASCTAAAITAAGWVVDHAPEIAPTGVVAAWLIAAGILAPREAWTLPTERPTEQADDQVLDEGEETPAEDPREALLDLLDEVTRGRNGVHLGELAEHPDLTGLPRSQLGPLLEAHGVPVTRSLSVAGKAGRSGVRRADVEALLAALPQEGSDTALAPTLAGSDLRKSQPLSPDSQPTLATVSAGGHHL